MAAPGIRLPVLSNAPAPTATPAPPADASAHPEIYVPGDRQALRGLRVTFINMPLREHAAPNCIPLGPALMAARLREWGALVQIIDLNSIRPHPSPEQVEKLITSRFGDSGLPDAVALSGLITTLTWQELVARQVRRLAPDCYLVSGGGLATDLPQAMLRWIPELDAVATGEGDDCIFKVAIDARTVRDRRLRWSTQRDLRRRLHASDSVYRGQRPRDLDSLPYPAWDLCDLDVYLHNPIWGSTANNSSSTPFTMKRSMNTVSSRGCPFACRYCDRTATGGRSYDVRSAQNLASEARLLMDRYDIDFLGIVDDNSMVVRERLRELVPAFADLRARGLRWGTHGRMDEAGDIRPDGRGASPPRVEWMAEAGCVYIGFGAESADPDMLTAMGKGGHILSAGMENLGGEEFPRTMVQALRNCKDVGIHPNSTWIMGYPGETLPQLKRTIRFILESEQAQLVSSHASNHSMFVATAYPGTEMMQHPVVAERIRRAFGDDLHHYVSELDDATKMISHGGTVLNYSAIDDDIFMKLRSLVEQERLEEILSL